MLQILHATYTPLNIYYVIEQASYTKWTQNEFISIDYMSIGHEDKAIMKSPSIYRLQINNKNVLNIFQTIPVWL